MTSSPLALLFSGALVAALAADSEAESCLKTKVWEAYSDGWSMRSLAPTDIAPGSMKVWKVTALASRTYRVLGCADARVKNLDLVVYNDKGVVVSRDSSIDRQPVVDLVPPKSGTYYVVAQARTVDGGDAPVDVAVAVIWK